MKVFKVILMLVTFLEFCEMKDPRKKTNFVDNFNYANLTSFVTKKKYVSVLFHDQHTKLKKLSAFFFSASVFLENKEVFFLQVNVTGVPKQELSSFRIHKMPSIKLYIYGIDRDYSLGYNPDIFEKWINQFLDSEIRIISNEVQIPEHESHYLVYVNKTLFDRNQAHFQVLAKLVAPITIYTGLSYDSLFTLTNREIRHVPLFFHRRFDNSTWMISNNLTLQEKAKMIHENEFPPVFNCTQESMHLILKQKLPILIYYSDFNNQTQFELIKTEVQYFVDYLKLLLIDARLDGSNSCNVFFRNFLAFKDLNTLRVLNTHEKVKRYDFIQPISESSIRIFLKHYMEENLKPFKISQNIQKDQKIHGINIGTSREFEAILKSRTTHGLFYVYTTAGPSFTEHMEALALVKSVFRTNRTFQVYALDHSKNDLDGYLHEKCPFVVLVTAFGDVIYFELEIEKEKLVRFVYSKLPFLELRDPEERGVEVETGL